MNIDDPIVLVVVSALCVAVGVFLHMLIQKVRLSSYQHLAAEMIRNAETEIAAKQQAFAMESKTKEFESTREMERKLQQERKKLAQEEERLKGREDKLEQRMSLVEKKLSELERKEISLKEMQGRVEAATQENNKKEQTLVSELEKVSQTTAHGAKEQLLERLRDELQSEQAQMIRKSMQEAQEHADRDAAKIIATVVQRLAIPCVNDTTINTVALPSEELKGRIIGREGRNIRALERATGVTFLIDDTPGAIVLSCYDPIRLHVAKLALEELLQDGRVHPTRIDEAVEKSQNNIEKMIRRSGEDAVIKAGVLMPHPEIVTLLGRLRFHHSLGQNTLEHSLEVAHIMGMIAAEMGLDVALAKRIGLFHDMGKAVGHEIEGSHAIIGHDMALRYGENADVANGIGCHHGEIAPTTIEAAFCGTADAISASRQGARSESLDQYVRRLKKLEDIAYSFDGVEKAYVIQAGREMKVVVLPERFDDDGVVDLARQLTKRIEKEVNFSGKIKITVIREKKAVEYAL